MQVANPNNVKIYNLSAGKSLPDWLSEKKRRTLLKHDGELRRRIELIQDFQMPGVSHYVDVTPDQQYIYACGIYKPRIRCYELSNVAMKFERCYDEEAAKFHILSDDYSKFVIMQVDRYIEFHSQMGRWYRVRIPRHGRDMDYHKGSCDMYFVGISPEIYRLNLERGSFLQSLKTDATEIHCCEFNPQHELFTCGTVEGCVECWDPRARSRAGKLDCAPHVLEVDAEITGVPSISSLKHKDALTFAVGTSTGQVLLYDIRSSKPLLVKDHNYGLPIKSIRFHPETSLVLSMDSRILKLWEEDTGKPYTSIEPESKLNSLCLFPNSGLLFMANEAPKILTYYIPSLGSAPKWCSFLDSLTEELEENPEVAVYDDYKFVTRQELDSLGMSNLIGSNLLRAYMHGYFMDVRLYHRAKAINEPFVYEKYRRNKIREKIEAARGNRVKVKKDLPKVNRDLAEKLMEESEALGVKKKKKEGAKTLLGDSRFWAMFERPEFQIDPESEEYRLLNPLKVHIQKEKEKKLSMKKNKELSDEDSQAVLEDQDDAESSSDDEGEWRKEFRRVHRDIRSENKMKKKHEELMQTLEPKFYELKSSSASGEKEESREEKLRRKMKKKSLADRLATEEEGGYSILNQTGSATGSMEMSFKPKKPKSEEARRQLNIEHRNERMQVRRSAKPLKLDKPKSLPWTRNTKGPR